MSHTYYDIELCKIQDGLCAALQLEPTQADRRQNRQLLANLYVRYKILANRLSDCIDQLVQPQKLLMIRKLLESLLGRILELKHDLVESDLNEWTHIGDTIDNLRVVPNDAELLVPRCYRNDRLDEIDYRNRIIDSTLSKLGYFETKEEKIQMTEQQAILVIQMHERARQGRLRAQFMREIRNVKDKSKPMSGDDSKSGGLSLNAAMRIQKIWRGYVARRATKRRKLQEMLLIGMLPQPKSKNPEIERDQHTKAYRRKLQKERMEEYEKDVLECRQHLEKHQRAIVLEQLSDQVRGWLNEYKTQTGKIPEYTGSERAASRMLLSRQGTDSDLSKSTPLSSKESKSKKDKSASKSTKESKSEGEEEEETTRAIVSTFLPTMNATKEEYDEVWRHKDESENPHQLHYMDMIENEQMAEMENELRKIVDEMMRGELALLQEAMDKDRGFKTKRKSSKKSRRGGKKSKKKKEKDLTPDRTTESLFEELVANGIIKKYPGISMQDFIGEISCNSPSPHNRGKEPKCALGDFRQILTEFCILPMLSQKLRETTPLLKSLMIAGANGSGKDMLVHAICNEAGAVLFDLTPANIVGKYPGKTGLTMLIHLVVKVSRLLQPSVIYMDNAERPFVKKIPKTDKTDPKRLKKDLPKIVKISIKDFCEEDRVILIGVSNCPWESDQKLLQQVYQKYLVIPRPEYSSRYAIWRHLTSQYNAITWQFDTSVVSKISDGYTIGSIVETFRQVMTVKRMLQLRVHALNPMELVNVLCTKTPIYKEEDEAMETWRLKTPICKKRTRAIEMLQQEEAEILAKQANAK